MITEKLSGLQKKPHEKIKRSCVRVYYKTKLVISRLLYGEDKIFERLKKVNVT